MARKREQQDIIDRQNVLREFDTLLATTSGRKVDRIFTFMVENDIQPRSPLPRYEQFFNNPSKKYLDRAWDLPSRHCFVSINQSKPFFTTLDHLVQANPNCWKWRAVDDDFQPAVWAGALLLRGDTTRSPQLPQVLTQALENAPTPQARHDRVVAILGGGFDRAINLLGSWGSYGWVSTSSYEPVFRSLFSALLDREREQDQPGMWRRWRETLRPLAHNESELEAWTQGIMKKVIEALPAFFSMSGKINSTYLNQEAIYQNSNLITILAHTTPQPQYWSDEVLSAIGVAAAQLLEVETKRGLNRTKALNPVLGEAFFKLLEDRPLPKRVYEAAAAYPFHENNVATLPAGPDFTRRLKVLGLTNIASSKPQSVQPKPKI